MYLGYLILGDMVYFDDIDLYRMFLYVFEFVMLFEEEMLIFATESSESFNDVMFVEWMY